MSSLSDLAERALRASIRTRRTAKASLDGPVSAVDLAISSGVTVRFLDISMEGLLIAGNRPTILLSSLRPIGRRSFTCAHELGHHVLGHGSTVDEVKKAAESGRFLPEEYLADTYAGFLLMPPRGVRAAFRRRGISIASATPIAIARVAAAFGVGFDTLVTQLAAQKEISEEASKRLRKSGPAGVRREVLGRDGAEPLHLVDVQFEAETIDAEVGDLVLLPADSEAGPLLRHIESIPAGNLFVAREPGIVRVWSVPRDWSAFVRVSRPKYVGLAAYRHMEDQDGQS